MKKYVKLAVWIVKHKSQSKFLHGTIVLNHKLFIKECEHTGVNPVMTAPPAIPT